MFLLFITVFTYNFAAFLRIHGLRFALGFVSEIRGRMMVKRAKPDAIIAKLKEVELHRSGACFVAGHKAPAPVSVLPASFIPLKKRRAA